MLYRFAYEKLSEWKDSTDKKKCLVVRGARQVGKTFLVRQFGAQEYENTIEINFLKSPQLKQIFSGNLDIANLLLNFSLYMPQVVFQEGRTLLFLDEIQECPEAITSLKFWMEDGRFDVIASGSMLGMDYNRPSSYPVGSVEYLDMTALGFPEFLRAEGIGDELWNYLKECFYDLKPVSLPIHSRMMELLRTYLAVGGMPEAVDAFVSQNSLSAADRVLRRILTDYRYDIAHYAPADVKIKAEACYFSIPAQLGKENHKFQYSVVEKGSNARKYGSSIDWLKNADIVTKVCNVDPVFSPLEDHREDNIFRLYATDIGMFTSMFDYSVKARLLDPEDQTLSGNTRGGIYEALIADMLYKSGNRNLYYSKNETSTFEIEFLLENRNGVVPVEVKAGNSRSKSLDTMLEREIVPFGYKLVDGNVGKVGKKITLPLYMAMLL